MNARSYLTEFNKITSNVEITGLSSQAIDYDDAVDTIITLIRNRQAQGKKVIIIGNGGSASIAGHMSIDLWKNAGVRALSFNDGPLLTCIGNDYGYPQVFARPITCFADESDVLIAISSSGASENILNAVQVARDLKVYVVTLSGFAPANPLRQLGDYNFYVASDSYGYVEVAHQLILHTMVDLMIMREPS